MRGTLARASVMLAALAMLAPFCSGYYYWIWFANSGGPYNPVPVRYDLNPADPYGLDSNTITYLISSQGPSALMPGDSFPALISQIRAAAEVWNSVSTSGIRLAFGGLSSMTTPDSSPEIDVVFSNDVTPGLIALTTITTVQNPGPLVAGGASFVPMLRAQIQLQADLTNPYPQPSSSDAFFLTVAHEFGHALGLQHTKSSSLMSTSFTRSTTKAQPLAADDIAGISLLYPVNGYVASTGSIAGTVAMNNGGVNLATVTALSTSGAAISALTNPDGTYQIDGVPPGLYYVYVQPLPPAQPGEAYPDNVFPPNDPFQNSYLANIGFGGQFYGATTDWTQASQVNVSAGNIAGGINFNVQPRSGPAVYDMVLYGDIGSPRVPVQGPPIQAGVPIALTFYAYSTATQDGYLDFAPGLSISAIGGTAQIYNLAPFSPPDPPYIKMAAYVSYSVQTATPTALAVNWNGDLYVLPAAFTVVRSAPPTVAAVSGSTDSQGNATVTVAGTNLGPGTRVFFDGAPGTVLNTNADGSLTVAAPPATNGYHASVEALSADSQTSAQTLGTAAPPGFTYNGPAFPAINVSPATVTAGSDTMVQIFGYNTNFVNGQTVVGFGSSDVVVKQLWVVSAGLVLVNVSVDPLAQSHSTTISVASGLQLATLSTAFQVTQNGAAQFSLRTPIVNQATQLAGVPNGGTAVINVTGLPPTLTATNTAGWTLSIGGQPAPFTISPGPNGPQILAAVPGGLPIGPAIVQLTGPSSVNPPAVLMEIDAAPPVLTSIQSVSGATVDATHPAHAGDTITLNVSGLADELGILPAASAVFVNLSGVQQNPSALVPTNSSGGAQMQVTLPWTTPSGALPIAVQVGTRLSAPYTIAIYP